MTNDQTKLKMEDIFGKTAQLTVLRSLIKNTSEPTYLSGIAAETGLSHSSVSRVILPLIEAGIVVEKPMGKQIRTFKMNSQSELARQISRFVSSIEGGSVPDSRFA